MKKFHFVPSINELDVKVDEGDDPVKECDDAATFWDEDDDYMVEED